MVTVNAIVEKFNEALDLGALGYVLKQSAGEELVQAVLASRGLEDRATVDGRFGSSGRTLSGTEIETITDLRTGERCRIHWRWSGRRS